jgi:hypothetical protein
MKKKIAVITILTLMLFTMAEAQIVVKSGATVNVKSNTMVYSKVDLTVNSGGTLDNSQGFISLKGNFTNNGTFTSGFGTVSFNGTSGQTIAGTGGLAFYNLTVGNSSTGITLNNNSSVNGTLTLASGNITTGANVLTLGFGAGLGQEGTLAYTSGTIIGSFKRYFQTSTSVSGVLFPVGDILYYRPVSISYPAGPSGGTITVKHYGADPENHNPDFLNDGGYSINVYSKQVYWDISSVMTGTYNISLKPKDILGVSSVANLHIIKKPLLIDNWVSEGTHSNGTGTNSDPTVYRNGLTSFSLFGIGSNSDNNMLQGALPIVLQSFNYSVSNRDVNLIWKTSEEYNNAGFFIERKSLDVTPNVWKQIDFVKGKGNLSSEYDYRDNKLDVGKYKYRLKQVDNNGNFEFYELSGQVEINKPRNYSLEQNYPNPFNPGTTIKYVLADNGIVKLKIFDILGREVATIVNEFQKAGYYEAKFSFNQLGNAGISSGIYFYRLEAGNYSKIMRMILVK